jgi:hypothetical protein
MREAKMEADWRTIQFFLSEEGVFEVEADSVNWRIMRCSCPKFTFSSRCSHVAKVKKELRTNDGTWSLKVPDEVEEEEILGMGDTAESFRDFILRYGKIGFVE